MGINLKIEELLKNEHGADIVGFADVGGLAPEEYKYAVVAALVLPAKVIDEIHKRSETKNKRRKAS